MDKVCLCIEVSDEDEQDVYLWEHLIAFLEDERIDAEVYWKNNPDDRTRTLDRHVVGRCHQHHKF